MIDSGFVDLSLRSQFDLLNLNRSNYYYQKVAPNQSDQDLANKIYELWLKYPFFGYRKITAFLNNANESGEIRVNHKKVQRIMKQMNLSAICPKAKGNYKKVSYSLIYPYLLKDLKIEKINQVWTTDITYIRMDEASGGGFTYFLAIIDLYSRFILASYLSTNMEADFCVDTLQLTLSKYTKPEIFNTDQGSQFTSNGWCDLLKASKIKISMDGKGRCFDNIFSERLWRTVKYEEVFLKSYDSVKSAREQLGAFVEFYNYQRPHQSLKYNTPADIYFGIKQLKNKTKLN
ncbi:MAG: IS3 family transposase [Bacteroidetes bacterium]|nr:IS3 family transposase [Bacteroidota bacterium]